jgi:hypothetical protein
MTKQKIIQRLSLVRYLFQKGIEQTHNSDPVSSFGLLHIHDSVEMCFLLACEKYGIKTDRLGFIEMFDSIDNELKKKNKTLQYRNDAKSLNELRRDLKHKGKFPSKIHLQEIVITSRLLLEHISEECFQTNFQELSLVSLIYHDDVKLFLQSAIEFWAQGNESLASEKLSLAFSTLLGKYNHISPFNDNFEYNYSGSGSYHYEHPVGRIEHFLYELIDGIQHLEGITQVLTYGIDYKKFHQFQFLTPTVTKEKNKTEFNHNNRKKIGEEDFQFCINFVVECALQLQEFGLDKIDKNKT